jgi:ankyrin repeat protein
MLFLQAERCTIAAGCGHLDVVKILCEHGADKAARNAEKQTPAMLAKDIAQGEWKEIVQYLS